MISWWKENLLYKARFHIQKSVLNMIKKIRSADLIFYDIDVFENIQDQT